MKKIVIIGASVGGHTVAAKLRELDKESSITLITEGTHPFYDKRKLPAFLSGQLKEEDILLANEEFYKQNNIDFVKERKVSSLNIQKRTIQTKEKNSFSFDFLIIASGGKPAAPEIPGARKNGVILLSSLADYVSFTGRIVSGVVCVWGSSQMALSVAEAVVSRYKTEVKLIGNPAIENTTLPAGIEIINKSLVEIIGDGEVQAVKFHDGKVIAASVVLCLERFRPNTDFLKNSGIESSEGFILVDNVMRTNVTAVFACGWAGISRDMPKEDKCWDDVVAEGCLLAENIARGIEAVSPSVA